MHSYSQQAWAFAPLVQEVRRALSRVSTAVTRLARSLTGVTPDQWFWVGFLLLLLVFFVVLLLQPTTVGRGGR
jgi:uncharacterized membrane protein